MAAMVRILVLLSISTFITGFKLPYNDPGSALYDDKENDPGSALYDGEENDPVSVLYDDEEYDPGSSLYDEDESDQGSSLYDAAHPVDQEIDNDPNSALSDVEFSLDFPFDEMNDPRGA